MISAPIQLRYGDFDMAGHVHNVAYFHYMESARVHFFVSELGDKWNWMAQGLIVKKNSLEYNVPIFIEDQINIEVACQEIGTKSFVLNYSIFDSKKVLKAYGETIMVCFDHLAKRTIEIPDAMRTALQKHKSA